MLATPLLLLLAIALTALAWNRLFGRVPWLIIGFFCAIIATYQAETLFTARVDLPGGISNSVFPWKGLERAPVRANTGIVMTELVPWTAAARQQLLSGELPFWNRGLGAGSPLLADQQTAIFHPFTLLGLLLPLGKAWTLSVGLRLFFCMFFLYVLLTEWRLPTVAALFGSLVYTFSTFHVVWLLFPLGLATMMLPLGLVAATELMRRPRWRSFLLLILALALAILGGHPESALFVALMVGAYTVYLSFVEEVQFKQRAARLASAGLAAVAAVLLTAPFWYPTYALLHLTDRDAGFQDLQQHPARRVSSEWLLPLVAPNILGTVPSGTYRRPVMADTSIPSDYGEVASGYCGIAPLALTFASLASWRRRPVGFFLAAMAIAFLTFAEFPAWYALVCRTPLVGMALHQRLRFLWVLGASIAASVALGPGFAEEKGRRALWVGLGGSALLLGGVYWLERRDLMGREATQVALNQLAISLAVLVILGGALARRLSSRVFGSLALLLTLCELLFVTWHYNPSARPSDVLPETGAIRAMRQGLEPHRVAAVGAALMPDTPGFFGLEDIKTTDPIHSPAYRRLLGEFLDVRGRYNERIRDWDSPFVNFLGVGAIYVPPDTVSPNPHWLQVYDGPDGQVLANHAALPRYFFAARWQVEGNLESAIERMQDITDFRTLTVVDRMPSPLMGRHGQGSGGTVRLRAYTGGSTSLAIESLGWNLLTSSDANWPGWRIRWNGKDLDPVTVNGAFLGVFVPAGRGILDLRYRPREFDTGLALCGATLIALSACFVAARLVRRRALA
jgi:hypothetical protein